jgi:HPt (histidine-containing phosphotransfer) domain-containing protein
MNITDIAGDLGLEEDEYRELLDLFFETGSETLKVLQEAIARGDSDTAGSAVHSFKGAAGNLGLTGLFEGGQKIVDLIREGQFDTIAPLVRELRQQFEELMTALP